MGILKTSLGVIVGIGIIGAAVSGTTPPKPKSPEELARDMQWAKDVAALRALKKAMHDPKSFELSQALRMQDGSICVTYRARNGFGALVVRQAVLGTDVTRTSDEKGFTALWNARCGGKTGEVLQGIGYAL